MGITGMITMPLLSTLAALVIIVHSAEEDSYAEYNRNLQSRSLNIQDDQPWKVMDPGSVIEQTTISDVWNNDSPEEPVRKRRPVRKRKRRPLIPETNERPKITNANRAMIAQVIENDDSYTTTPLPLINVRRRRKRPQIRQRWPEHTSSEAEIPLRNVYRKKPHLSEFDFQDDDIKEPTISPYNIFNTKFNKEKSKLFDTTLIDDVTEQGVVLEDVDNDGHQVSKENTFRRPVANINGNDKNRYSKLDLDTENSKNIKQSRIKFVEDKSLSDISSEDNIRPLKSNLDISDENSPDQNSDEDSPENSNKHEPIAPLTLKEILKRSNGSSLSEILQQNNLSLSDLLKGKHKALSLLKQTDHVMAPTVQEETYVHRSTIEVSLDSKPKQNPTTSTTTTTVSSFQETEPETDKVVLNGLIEREEDMEENNDMALKQTTTQPTTTTKPKRQNSMVVRRKVRKGNINKDLFTPHTRRHQNNSRNVSKGKEWQSIIPLVMDQNNNFKTNESVDKENHATIPGDQTYNPNFDSVTIEIIEEQIPTTTKAEDTTVNTIISTTPIMTLMSSSSTTTKLPMANKFDGSNDEHEFNYKQIISIETTETNAAQTTTEKVIEITEKPKITPIIKSVANNSFRRQMYNNRLKRKRIKSKNIDGEGSQSDRSIPDLFTMSNLVSASEFITKTQTAKPSTVLSISNHTVSAPRQTRGPNMRFLKSSTSTSTSTTTTSSTTTTLPPTTETEEIAKIEIEEILNDTLASSRLSRILKERNMTLDELLEHRERGSSQVHLADIFHNASREPNPPEPFLSKSLLEPISKETYPLRAILEANLHDPKLTTSEPDGTGDGNVPVVMDFGNNVNENGETMGIMALFNKITENDSSVTKSTVKKDSSGIPYVTTVENVNINTSVNNSIIRDSRMLNENQDVVSWNEIFSLMKKNHYNETEEILGFTPSAESKVTRERDVDGDGLIVLEDLQNLNEYETKAAPAFEGIPKKEEIGVLKPANSSAKSVTIVTVSIIGLALVLFLLTYAAFKWRQQRGMPRQKDSFTADRIPSPVYENRKGNKNNCSSRSISPMLSSSNIYTLNTMDSNGTDSPDYMWDSLRKPFQ